MLARVSLRRRHSGVAVPKIEAAGEAGSTDAPSRDVGRPIHEHASVSEPFASTRQAIRCQAAAQPTCCHRSRNAAAATSVGMTAPPSR